MGLTVRQILQIEKLKDAVVVAGHQGLDNQVCFFNIMEVPEVTRWMKGGEFLVTAGFAIKDDVNLRKKLIYDLAEKNVAAFGIKPGQYFNEIPKDMIEHADRVGLPLLQLPSDVPYMEFMLPIFEILISQQLNQLKRNEQIHHCMLEALLSGGGSLSICKALYDSLGRPVYIIDNSGNIVNNISNEKYGQGFSSGELMGIWTQLDNELLKCRPNRCNRINLEFSGKYEDVVLVPVQTNNTINGYIFVLDTEKKLDDQDLAALEYAGTISAIEFVKEKSVFETERKIRGELLEDLISGNFPTEETVIRRASYLNFNLNSKLVTFIANIDQFEKYMIYHTNQDENHIQEIKNHLFEEIHKAFLGYNGGTMLLMKSNCIIGLIRMECDMNERVLNSRLIQICGKVEARYPEINISIGVGKTYKGARNIKNSYEEAETSLKVMHHLNEEKKILFFQELGPYRFLYELKGSEAMKTFYNEILGKIEQYDLQSNSNLVSTLNSYFKNDCSLLRTAENMLIHKNSVIYRIKKIEEITGLKLSNPDDRFNLLLCIKLKSILD
jgi:PucR family transcriptional regulator, purine catabolism regulatory protein